MNKFWSLLFFTVPVLGTLVFVVAWMGREASTDAYFNLPFTEHWLPEDISETGYRIDGLFNFILILTGIVFILTECALVYFLWKYDGLTSTEPTKFTHGNHALEIIWSVVPSMTLVFIALHQLDAWREAKMASGAPQAPVEIEVIARQFEWRLRYPGPNGKLGDADDFHTVNDLHVPVNRDVQIVLRSQDVLHSFFLPNLRVKQDAVPGMKQNVWFKAKKEGQYDLVCAELCGWGHYKMKGFLTVQSQEAYDRWHAEMVADSQRTQSKQKKQDLSEQP